MSGIYNWARFQTFLIKYFKPVEFKVKEGTKTIRLSTWERGDAKLEIKYSHTEKSERFLGLKIIRNREGKPYAYVVDLKTYSFGFDHIEKSPYIRWEVNNHSGYRCVNFHNN